MTVLRKYLLLVRLPNTFTAPSNILSGYFAVVSPWHANVPVLAILMASSALLYVSGIVFNDFFDIEIDRKERPFRPLPSNEITKQKALIIAAASMIIANLLAFAAGTASLIVAIILSATIIGYDYRLKQTVAGPVTMGGARFLNIFLCASPGLAGISFYNNNFLLTRLLLVCILMLLYVLAISILSRMEVGGVKSIRRVIGPFLIIFAIIGMIVFGVFDRTFQVDLVVCLILFASIIIVTFKRTIFQDYSSIGIQKAIKTMVLSIIVLDSVFVSGTAGLYYGLATLLLIIPSIVLARELYVT
ncbi:MAG: UbiA family prenyltransferase [Candidatus Nitrosopolaris sp.]